jgi:exopolysaccharide production protein ExoQ
VLLNQIPSSSAYAAAGADSYQTQSCRLTEFFLPARKFPWLLFVASWLITLGLQARIDASLLWLNGGEASSDMAAEAADGSLERRILGLLLGFVGLMLISRLGRTHIRLNGVLSKIWILLIGWNMCSVFWAEDPGLTVRRLSFFLLTLTFAAGCALLREEIIPGFVLGFVILNLIAGVVAEFLCGTFKPLQADYRFAGTFHPNLQGASLALGILVSLWWWWQSRNSKMSHRKALLFVTVVCACFLGLTSSRTSLVALLVSLLFSCALIFVRYKRSLVPLASAIALIVLVVLVGVWSLLPAGTFHTSGFIERSRDDGDPSDLTGRVEVWKECLGYIAERPWVGYGFDSFWSAEHIEDFSSDLQWPINQSHSSYIQQLLDLGIPGLTLYVAILLASFSICVHKFRGGSNFHGLCATIVIFVMIHNLSESINVLPTFPNFVLNIVALRIAFYNSTKSYLNRNELVA